MGNLEDTAKEINEIFNSRGVAQDRLEAVWKVVNGRRDSIDGNGGDFARGFVTAMEMVRTALDGKLNA